MISATKVNSNIVLDFGFQFPFQSTKSSIVLCGDVTDDFEDGWMIEFRLFSDILVAFFSPPPEDVGSRVDFMELFRSQK
jgi:hypothetical protein